MPLEAVPFGQGADSSSSLGHATGSVSICSPNRGTGACHAWQGPPCLTKPSPREVQFPPPRRCGDRSTERLRSQGSGLVRSSPDLPSCLGCPTGWSPHCRGHLLSRKHLRFNLSDPLPFCPLVLSPFNQPPAGRPSWPLPGWLASLDTQNVLCRLRSPRLVGNAEP